MSSLIFRDIELKRQRNAQQFEGRKERWLAKLVRFNGNLDVPNRPGFVYAQQLPEDDAPPPIPVLCVATTQKRENLRVWVERNREGDWEVVSWWRGIVQQDDYDDQAYLPQHARDHEWPDRNPHVDAVNVYQRAIVPLRSSPGSTSSLLVRVEPYRYLDADGTITIFAGDASVDLSGSQPAAGLARYVGIYLDTSTNTIGTVNGATTLDAGPVTPDSPTFPSDVITSAMVRLDGSQSAFSESDFVDLRIFLGDADTSSNYPYDFVAVDGTDVHADYTGLGELDTAFGAEGAATYAIGLGQFTQATNAMPDGAYLFQFVRSGSNGVFGEIAVGGTTYGLRLGGDAFLFGVYASRSDNSNPAGGLYVPDSATVLNWFGQINGVASGGADDAYGILAGTNATVTLYGGFVGASSVGGTAYGISAGAGSTVSLNGCPVINADTFFTGAGSFVGIFQDISGNLYEIDGVAGTERLVNSFLKASDGAPDPAWAVDATGNMTNDGGGVLDLTGTADALVLDDDGDSSISSPTDDQIDFEVGAADEAHLTAYGLSAQNHAFRVTNSSGGAVVAGDVGYLDASGEYVETTTAYANLAWCVVVKGGADTADIYVANRGQATVTLDGNCSAGDLLYTSTTAGQATTLTYPRPELFAVALTANGAGAGGTCSALLLCHTLPVAAVSTTTFYAKNSNHSGSDFVATLNGAPVGAAVVYNAPSSGNEEFIEPFATLLTKMRLYNSTRGTYAKISSVNLGTNTITVSDAADVAAWQNGDTITVRSQTNTGSVGTDYFVDLELDDTAVFPTLTRSIILSGTFRDSAAASQRLIFHPWETYVATKEFNFREQGANIAYEAIGPDIPLIQRRMTFLCQASGVSTVNAMNFNVRGYNLAVP